jgi:DHA1 family multidrug resistance protein-like MFS transporter
MARRRRVAAPDPPPQPGAVAGAQSLVRSLALTTFLLWLGASAILPLLPEYLRDHGASDGLVGVVMASYFAAALVCQYPAGRMADKVGRRPVLVGGLVCYAVGSFGFLAPVGPAADIGLRSLQGAGAGAAEVAALAMIAGNVALGRRGRAFASVYGAQLAALAIGPLVGSLIGVSAMSVVFYLAGAIAMIACLPSIAGGVVTRTDSRFTATDRQGNRGLPRLNRSLVGALCTAAALGLTIGVYESCWTLLLDSRHAHDWQVGLSWTLFALPFVAMARPGGWLADHADRRWLVIGSLVSSVFFCSLYPFVTNLSLLLALGGLEAVGLAVALPSAQSLLTQGSAEGELGRVQGLFSTSETGAIAVSAGVAGALFGLATWAPFIVGAVGAGLLAACLPAIWWPVAGRVRFVVPSDHATVADRASLLEA